MASHGFIETQPPAVTVRVDKVTDIMHSLTTLSNWSVEDVRQAPELYRAYLREQTLEVAAMLMGVPMLEWPASWTFSD